MNKPAPSMDDDAGHGETYNRRRQNTQGLRVKAPDPSEAETGMVKERSASGVRQPTM